MVPPHLPTPITSPRNCGDNVAKSIKVRLNIRLEEDLKQYMQDYAIRHGQTISSIVREYFLKLRQLEVGTVEQI